MNRVLGSIVRRSGSPVSAGFGSLCFVPHADPVLLWIPKSSGLFCSSQLYSVSLCGSKLRCSSQQNRQRVSMCIAFWLLDKHPTFWLILALNRDEFHARPTRPFHFWEDEEHKSILGGRDLQSGGTWMGLTKSGRLAFLTNVREANWKDRPEKTSRGELPTGFLISDKSPLQYADQISHEADNYNGFNLVVADFTHQEMAFVSNRHGNGEDLFLGKRAKSSVKKLSPGLHSLSNGTLDSKWPKMERGRKLLTALFVEEETSDRVPSDRIVEEVLRDRERTDDVSAQQAETHCPEDFEIPLSSIFVETGLDDRAYGTRSMTVMGIRRNGQISVIERYLEGIEWKSHSFQFQVEGGAPLAS